MVSSDCVMCHKESDWRVLLEAKKVYHGVGQEPIMVTPLLYLCNKHLKEFKKYDKRKIVQITDMIK